MKKIVTILLCILLIIQISSLCVIFKVDSFINKDNMKSQLDTVDFSKIDINNDPYFGDYFTDIYDLFETFNISTNILDNFINSNITKHFVGEVSSNIIQYIIDGNDRPIVTDNYIDEFSTELVDYTLKQITINIDGILDKKVLTEVIATELKANISELPTTSQIENKIDDRPLSIIRIITSDSIKTIIIISIIIVTALIIFLNIKQFKWISKLAISVMISGIILWLVSIIGQNIIDNINIDLTSTIYLIVTQLINSLLMQIKSMATIMIIISVVVISIYIIVKNIIKGANNDI